MEVDHYSNGIRAFEMNVSPGRFQTQNLPGHAEEGVDRSVSNGHGYSNSVFNLEGKGNIRSRFRIGRELGKGGGGIVHLCEDLKTGQDVAACKSVPKRLLQRKEAVIELVGEISAMKKLSGHPHIVTLEDVYEDAGSVHLVMEYCEAGDLFEFVTAKKCIDEPLAARIISQILLALSHCHRNNILHRDIKPENILLTRSPCETIGFNNHNNVSDPVNVKLADFGIALELHPAMRAVGMFGSAIYMAPEVVKREAYSFEADVWGAGVVLYTMLSGNIPFWGASDEELHAQILEANLDFDEEPWPSISPGAKSLVRQLLCPDPRRRISAEFATSHPWISSMTWVNSRLPPQNPSKLEKAASLPRPSSPPLESSGSSKEKPPIPHQSTNDSVVSSSGTKPAYTKSRPSAYSFSFSFFSPKRKIRLSQLTVNAFRTERPSSSGMKSASGKAGAPRRKSMEDGAEGAQEAEAKKEDSAAPNRERKGAGQGEVMPRNGEKVDEVQMPNAVGEGGNERGRKGRRWSLRRLSFNHEKLEKKHREGWLAHREGIDASVNTNGNANVSGNGNVGVVRSGDSLPSSRRRSLDFGGASPMMFPGRIKIEYKMNNCINPFEEGVKSPIAEKVVRELKFGEEGGYSLNIENGATRSGRGRSVHRLSLNERRVEEKCNSSGIATRGAGRSVAAPSSSSTSQSKESQRGRRSFELERSPLVGGDGQAAPAKGVLESQSTTPLRTVEEMEIFPFKRDLEITSPLRKLRLPSIELQNPAERSWLESAASEESPKAAATKKSEQAWEVNNLQAHDDRNGVDVVTPTQSDSALEDLDAVASKLASLNASNQLISDGRGEKTKLARKVWPFA